MTLRYAYGAAHDEQIPGLVERWRAAPTSRWSASQRAWRDWLPRAELEGDRAWLQRELQWDAYMLRSGDDVRGGLRPPHPLAGRLLPVRQRPPDRVPRPAAARPAAHPRRAGDRARDDPLLGEGAAALAIGLIPYGMTDMCTRLDLGSSNDLDLWLLLAAAEYGLASRDAAFFDERIAWADGGEATLWEHLRFAHEHQESQRGPHGGYITGATGDWSDFSTQATQMTESMLVSAQLTYVYPRLAELAELRGDDAFAAALRADAGRAARGARPRVGRQGLVHARLQPRQPDRRGRDLRRAAAVGAARRRADARAGRDARGQHPPLPDRRRRAAGGRRARRGSARRSRRPRTTPRSPSTTSSRGARRTTPSSSAAPGTPSTAG